MGAYGLADPGSIDPTKDHLAEIREWAVLGYTIEGTVAAHLDGLDRLLTWQGMKHPDTQAFNNAAKGVIGKAGWAITIASTVYEGYSISNDPDFDGLADNWWPGFQSIPYWVRDGLSRSAIVLGKGIATTTVGIATGSGASFACGGPLTPSGLGCGFVAGNAAGFGTEVYLDRRMDGLRDPYIPPIRQPVSGE